MKAELAHANTPAVVRAWISQPPAWLGVVSLKQPVDSALEHLDAGEREAISLASELQAILLLMDERDGVTIARHRGLKVVGTLAAFDLAAAHELVDLQTMFERLRATTFRSPLRLMVTMLEQAQGPPFHADPVLAELPRLLFPGKEQTASNKRPRCRGDSARVNRRPEGSSIATNQE